MLNRFINWLCDLFGDDSTYNSDEYEGDIRWEEFGDN